MFFNTGAFRVVCLLQVWLESCGVDSMTQVFGLRNQDVASSSVQLALDNSTLGIGLLGGPGHFG